MLELRVVVVPVDCCLIRVSMPLFAHSLRTTIWMS